METSGKAPETNVQSTPRAELPKTGCQDWLYVQSPKLIARSRNG